MIQVIGRINMSEELVEIGNVDISDLVEYILPASIAAFGLAFLMCFFRTRQWLLFAVATCWAAFFVYLAAFIYYGRLASNAIPRCTSETVS